MRVVAGRYGGRRLRAPAGAATRPTSDRVREALFAVLGPVAELRVLDLFAGAGGLGIEALSRGAAEATFVDSAPAAIRALRDNLSLLGIDAECHRQDALAFLRNARRAARTYDLVLLDPPYRLAAKLGPQLGPLLEGVAGEGARVVSESGRHSPLELELPLIDERRYGDTLIRIHEPE
ncbi:MAG TPA: 16S rRNA (guanine(966)-N(2))-methyltransferase RsmD [Solirubrobacteraceae bacterium]|nr:16S rRNA (guanine(966)-N(2))-methyltransferase RsmD [Solirubrobacteraceae bacterium]